MLSLFRALAEEGVEYVVVGAVALNLHGIVRATEDLDLFVRADVGNVERLRSALRAIWDDPEIAEIRAEDLAGDYPVVRYGPPEEDFVIDLMSRLGDAISFDDLRWETISVEGVNVRVATPITLYEMKGAPSVPSIERMQPSYGECSRSKETDVGVWRFREHDAARRDLWTDSDDPRLPGRIARLWRRTARLVPAYRAEGVRRFRNIEEANEDRDRAVETRARAIRTSRASREDR